MNLGSLPPSIADAPSLEEMGFEGVELQRLKIAATSPVGLIVVAGMSDSLSEVSVDACAKLAAESFSSPRKIKVMPHGLDADFRSNLQMLLRSAPDVLLLNELRNGEQFSSAINAASSGLKTLASLHAADSFRIITRMIENGVSPEEVRARYSVAALVYQVSLSILCRHCSLSMAEAKAGETRECGAEQFRRFEFFMQPEHRQMLRFRNHSGCEHCQSGVTGTTVVAEVLTPDETLVELMINDQWEDAMTYFRSQGGRTLFDNALSKVLRGICDLRQVESKTDVIHRHVVLRRGGAVSLYEQAPEIFSGEQASPIA